MSQFPVTYRYRYIKHFADTTRVSHWYAKRDEACEFWQRKPIVILEETSLFVDPDPCFIISTGGEGVVGCVYAKIGSFRVLGKAWFWYVSGSIH